MISPVSMRIGAADSSTRCSLADWRREISSARRPEVERRAGRERLAHRLGQQLAVGLLDHARDLLERLAGGGLGIRVPSRRAAAGFM